MSRVPLDLILREHQTKAAEEISAAFGRGDRRVVLEALTGFGKTGLACHLIDKHLTEGGKRVIFTAPAISLIDQTVDRFRGYGIPLGDMGVLQASHPLTNPYRPIQIASVQTLARRAIPPSTFVVIDEVHQRFDSIDKWMDDYMWREIPFLGLSATPWSKGLGVRWKTLIATDTLPDLTEKGWFKRLRYFRPSVLDTTGMRITAGDYNEKDLSEASREVHILSDAVQRWVELGQGRPTIAFCVDRQHARSMQERFELSNIPCGYIDGTMDQEARDIEEAKLRTGQVKVIVSVGCLTTGIDWPYVSCILWARKTKSKILWIQGIGRGLRPHPDTNDCILIDCVGNEELGHPYDVRQGYLHDGSAEHADRQKREKEQTKPARCCVQCKAIKPANVRTCPECGYTPPAWTRVVEGDAKLTEFKSETSKNGAVGPLLTKEQERQERQEWFDSFFVITRQRGYKEGWAAFCYKDRFGDWPSAHGIKWSGVLMPVDPKVESWIRARAIRHAKAKAKQSKGSNPNSSLYR